MLPKYDFDPMTALWAHVDGTGTVPLSLHDVTFTPQGIEHPDHRRTEGEDALESYLVEGEQILRSAQVGEGEPGRPDLTEDFERLRWFHLPDEIRKELLEG